MTQQLVLFLFVSGWAYLAVALFRRDGWGALGRCLQFALLALASGAVLASYDRAQAVAMTLNTWAGGSFPWFWDRWLAIQMGSLFFVTTFGPVALQRRSARLAARGRLTAAARWERAARVAAWQWVPEVERVLGRARRCLEYGMPEEAARALNGLDGRRLSGGSRGRKASLEIEAAVLLHRWEEARRTFETSFSLEKGDAPPTVLYGMVRVYLEQGRTDRALACLEQADAQREATTHPEVHRFMAYVAVYAMSGKVGPLRELIYDPASPAWDMPPPFRPYWLGVAYGKAEDEEGARRCLLEAWHRVDPADEDWREAVRGRLADLGDTAASSLGFRRTLGLKDLWKSPPPVSPLTYGAGGAPLTTALVALGVLAWFVTDVWSADDAHSLILFGANVPSWVRRGQFWRLGAGLFLHAGALHLAFNMYALHLLGGFLERVAGHAAMLAVFVLSGLGAAAATAFLSPYSVSVGASGAVLGLLGTALMLVMGRRGLFPARLRGLYATNFGFVAAASVLIGGFAPEIDNYAHAGGLGAGMALGAVGLLAPRRPRLTRWSVRVAAAVSALLLVGSAAFAVRNAALGGYPHGVRLERVFEPGLGMSFQVPRVWRRDETIEKVCYSNAMDIGRFRYQDWLIVSARGGPVSAEWPTGWERTEKPGPARGLVATIYEHSEGGTLARFEFLCDRDLADSRRRLYERIVSSVEPLRRSP